LQTLKTAVLTARQPSVAIIGGAQIPSELESEILASPAITICTGLRDTDNIRVTASAMGIPLQAAHGLFQSLSVGEAVVRVADRPGPLKVEVPLVQIPRACDEARRQERVRRFQESCSIQPGTPWEVVFKAMSRQGPRQPHTPSQRAVGLLREAARHHERPICLKDLANACGQSIPEASSCSKELEACGLAKRHAEPIGRTQMVFVEPTKEGFEFLGVAPPTGVGRGGPGHRY
jgi:hypothetical protein